MKPWNVQTSVFLTALLFLLTQGFTGNSSDEIEGNPEEYRRRYVISIPEPLVCFPGYDDKVLELQNATILEDMYNFRVVKLYDFVPLMTTMGAPLFIATSILKVLLRYADRQWFQDFGHDLVDAKIDASSVRTEIARLRAKIDTIYNRLSTVLDDRYPEDIKTIEIAIAVDKSEEILNILRDKEFIFKRYPEVSMPFVVIFYGPCKILLQVARIFIPSKREVYENQLGVLKDTVEEYKQITMNGRIDQLFFDKSRSYDSDIWTWTKNAFKHQVLSFHYDIKLHDHYGGWGSCHKVRRIETFNETESELLQAELLAQYMQDVKAKYENFFSSPTRVFSHQECSKACDEATTASAVSMELGKTSTGMVFGMVLAVVVRMRWSQ